MAVHIFREHNQDADAPAEHGAKGERKVWEDAGDVVWSGVSGICGFWDGSCRACGCKCSLMLLVGIPFTRNVNPYPRIVRWTPRSGDVVW